ncbi:MAG: YicC/YloC family endoribonuclease [Bacillota bacterium]
MPTTRSMTGYGRGAALGEDGRVLVEIRSYNHRFLDLSIRMPVELASLEDRVRRALQALFQRGRLDIHITLEESPGRDRIVEVDSELARCYHAGLLELAGRFSLEPQGLLPLLAELPGVIRVKETPPDAEAVWALVEAALLEAAKKLAAMRKAEGEAIERDLIHRLDRVAHLTDEIGARAPLLTEEYRERLTRRVSELLRDSVVAEERLTTEIVLYAERSSITEELVRLESHLEQFRGLFGVDEAVGRKAEFILQEMVREINTVGSKTQHPDIGSKVVEVKTELEKIREQIQNVE